MRYLECIYDVNGDEFKIFLPFTQNISVLLVCCSMLLNYTLHYYSKWRILDVVSYIIYQNNYYICNINSLYCVFINYLTK